MLVSWARGQPWKAEVLGSRLSLLRALRPFSELSFPPSHSTEESREPDRGAHSRCSLEHCCVLPGPNWMSLLISLGILPGAESLKWSCIVFAKDLLSLEPVGRGCLIICQGFHLVYVRRN